MWLASIENHGWQQKASMQVAMHDENEATGLYLSHFAPMSDSGQPMSGESASKHLVNGVVGVGYAVRLLPTAGARLAGAMLAGARLAGARLAGARLAGARLAGARLAGARLAGASVAGAWLAGAWLAGAWLAGAWLAGAWLAGAWLAGAWLAGACVIWGLGFGDLRFWCSGRASFWTRQRRRLRRFRRTCLGCNRWGNWRCIRRRRFTWASSKIFRRLTCFGWFASCGLYYGCNGSNRSHWSWHDRSRRGIGRNAISFFAAHFRTVFL